MSQVPDWPPRALLGSFMAGLKNELSHELRMRKHKDLKEVVELAVRKDEQLKMTRGTVTAPARSTGNRPALVHNPAPISAAEKARTSFRLSDDEFGIVEQLVYASPVMRGILSITSARMQKL